MVIAGTFQGLVLSVSINPLKKMKDITLILKLNDQLTGKLKSVVGKASAHLKGLQDKLSGVNRETNNQFKGIGEEVKLNGSQLTSALGGVATGIAVAGAGLIAAFGKSIKDSDDLSRDTMSASGATSALLGLTFRDALEMQEKLTAKMAERANYLRGDTSHFTRSLNTLTDTLIGTKDFTKQGLSARGQRLVENATLLSVDANKPVQEVTRVLGKLLGESPEKKILRHDAIENNPAIETAITMFSKEKGLSLDGFFDADIETRTQILDKALASIYSKDRVDAMAGTLNGQFETAMGKLFDTKSGVFGFSRDVEFSKGDITNTYKELGRLFKAFTDLGSSAKTLLEVNGIVFGDPIKNFIQGIRGVTGWLQESTGLLFDAFNSGDNINARMIGERVGDGIGELLGRLFQGLGMDDGTFTNKVWSALIVLGEGIGGVIHSLDQKFSSWLVSEFGTWWQGFQDNTRKEFAALDTIGAGLFKGINDSLNTFSGNLGNAFTSLFGNVSSAVSGLWGRIQAAIDAIPIPSWLRGGSGNAQQAQSQLAVGGRYMGQNLHLMNAYKGLNMSSLMGAVNNEMIHAPQGSHPVIANSSEVIIPRSKLNQLQNTNIINIQLQPHIDRLAQEIYDAVSVSLRPIQMID